MGRISEEGQTREGRVRILCRRERLEFVVGVRINLFRVISKDCRRRGWRTYFVRIMSKGARTMPALTEAIMATAREAQGLGESPTLR